MTNRTTRAAASDRINARLHYAASTTATQRRHDVSTGRGSASAAAAAAADTHIGACFTADPAARDGEYSASGQQVVAEIRYGQTAKHLPVTSLHTAADGDLFPLKPDNTLQATLLL